VGKLVVHCKRAPFDVYIGRPSKWGNPFKIVHPRRTRERAIEDYRLWINGAPILVQTHGDPPSKADIRRELRGKVLGCYCAPLPCHGDVLAEIANAPPPRREGSR
jgi:hypothetical protein